MIPSFSWILLSNLLYLLSLSLKTPLTKVTQKQWKHFCLLFRVVIFLIRNWDFCCLFMKVLVFFVFPWWGCALFAELIRSLHVYRLENGKERQVEREFLFRKKGSFVEMAATPLLRLRGFQVSELFEGRVIGLWFCLFAFHADSSPSSINIPPVLLISRYYFSLLIFCWWYQCVLKTLDMQVLLLVNQYLGSWKFSCREFMFK